MPASWRWRAVALAHLTCHQAILTAPPGSTMVLIANPEFIAAFGGVSVISALLYEPAGTPVLDGTVVQFFTNLGRIDEQGKTNDGVARVNLVSDSRSGKAKVQAFSGGSASGGGTTASPSPGGGSGASASVEVIIGSALPARIVVTAFPSRIVNPLAATIRAFVVDTNGKPVFNVPVVFSVEQAGSASRTEFIVTERLVHPYGLGYREGEWYLVGEDQEKKALRQFKVVRIQGAVQAKMGRGPAFQVPAGCDIEQVIERPPWEYAGGKAEVAEIRFHEDVAWMVAENLLPGQQFDIRQDGTGVLRLKVRKAPDTHQKLLNFLAGYSGQCAVTSPPWLRKQAIEHLKALLERYV